MDVRKRFVGFACLLLWLASPIGAQEPARVVREGWHTVRPGETLWAIAARYLGSEESWPILHALNSDIENPHRISPGQRVRVQVTEAYAGDVAKVVGLSRRVEDQLTPHPWRPSVVENLLKPRDGIRTFEASSSELLFADDSRLVMSEDSLVFLGHAGRVERQVRRDEIEIVVGQGDFGSGLEAKGREFVIGDSRVTPSTAEVIQARMRRFDAGNSQVMVYEGESAIESGGTRQTLGSGMGTQMMDGEPPAPPEPLLTAPEARSPEADSELWKAAPRFSWSAVTGAVGYVLEVCVDPACGGLVAKVEGLEEAEHGAVELEEGRYFWRVTPVSPSGLDGYPSTPTPFAIMASVSDASAPVIEARFTGPRIERDGTVFLGAGAALEVDARDGESGVERVWAELDGREVEIEAVQAPWEPGAHRLVIRARDRAQNEGASPPLEFVYDAIGPEIHWGLESAGLYHSYTGEQPPVVRPGRATARTPKLTWSLERRDWRRLGADTERVERSFAPRFYLRSAGRRTVIYGADSVFLPIKRGKGVGVLAHDRLVGTEWLDFRVEDANGDPRLIVEAVDWLGNRSSVSWPLGRGRRTGSR